MLPNVVTLFVYLQKLRVLQYRLYWKQINGFITQSLPSQEAAILDVKLSQCGSRKLHHSTLCLGNVGPDRDKPWLLGELEEVLLNRWLGNRCYSVPGITVFSNYLLSATSYLNISGETFIVITNISL